MKKPIKSGLPAINGMVNIQGLAFPVADIQAAMLETGGTLVVQSDLVEVLNEALLKRRLAGRDDDPASIIIEAIPAYRFVPMKVKKHFGKPGTPIFDIDGVDTNMRLWFAVKRIY